MDRDVEVSLAGRDESQFARFEFSRASMAASNGGLN